MFKVNYHITNSTTDADTEEGPNYERQIPGFYLLDEILVNSCHRTIALRFWRNQERGCWLGQSWGSLLTADRSVTETTAITNSYNLNLIQMQSLILYYHHHFEVPFLSFEAICNKQNCTKCHK